MAVAACSTPSGAGFGVMWPSSRVTTTSKSSSESAPKRRSDRSIALSPLRVRMPTASPAERSRRTVPLGAFVGRGGVRRLEFEALQRERGGVTRLARGQRQDPLEHELVRRAADLALDRGEVERAGVGQRAVEVEEDGTEPERPRGAAAGAARLVVTRRRP